MQDNKNKRPNNKNNEGHGYWEVFYPNTNYLWYTAYMINGEIYGMTISDIRISYYAR